MTGAGDTPTPILETDGLVVRFGGMTALDHVNLTVYPGELRALIGPNGAGKTTFFNAVTGMIRPTAGRVLFKGVNTAGMPPHRICRLGVSRSFQMTSIFPELNVAENVWLGFNARTARPWRPLARASRQADTSGAVAALLDKVGLTRKAHHIAANLSHGDQKLLEMAIALSLEPALLLLDEPTQGVSPQEVETINQVILDIAGSRTILLIDHNMSTITRLARKVTVLHHGAVILEGPPQEVVEDARVREVYLGSGLEVCHH